MAFHERLHVPPLAGIRCDSKQSKGFSSLVAVSEVEFESLENEIGLPVPAIVKRPNDPVGAIADVADIAHRAIPVFDRVGMTPVDGRCRRIAF